MKRTIGLLVAVFLFVLGGGGAGAATLNVAGGQLIGATGVDVGGTLFDVAFIDGTCVVLFSGCDEFSDFTFTTEPAAELAAQALLDQVLLDDVLGSFDLVPSLTSGCTSATECNIFIPHGDASVAGPGKFASTFLQNTPLIDINFGVAAPLITFDTTTEASSVFAVFTVPIPEPNTALLVSMGLAGLGWRGRQGLSTTPQRSSPKRPMARSDRDLRTRAP